MGINYDEKSCGIVLFREEKGERLYLLLHYPGGHWDLPKGHVETRDQSEVDTAKRELLEETGISQVECREGFREQISYEYRTSGGKRSNKEVIFFLAKTDQKKVKISFEHHNSIWLPYDAAFNKLTFDNAKNIVKKAEQFLA